MAIKSILLAITEPQSLIDITQALGADWDVTSVACEEDALEHLEKRSFDALLVDFNLGSPDGSDLLNLALEKHPQTIRFLLAYEADLALVAAKVEGSPQILPKPVDPISIKERIEDEMKDSDTELVAREEAETPSPAAAIPSIYADVLKAIEAPGASCEQVAEIIARDEALTSEILSLTRSSYLGLPRDFNRPVDAVESLGLEAVRAAVMALQFLAEHSGLKPTYLSLDQLWQHSINVGQIARDLMLFETKDRALASQALIAGLLHDLGKVVLATNFADLYARVHSLARKQPVAIWEIEKEMFGANHGEIGACLVGMWNMPSAIVDAAALHHEPPVGDDEQLTPMGAVHIANVLERELWLGREDTLVAPVMNAPFLNHLGLLQRLPVWRASFANSRSPDLEEAELSQDDESGAGVAESSSGTVTELAGTRSKSRLVLRDNAVAVDAGRYRMTWVYATTASILVLLTLWFTTKQDLHQGEPVYARTFASHEPAPVFSWTPSSETPAPAVPEVQAAPPAPVVEPPAPAAMSTRVPEPVVSSPVSEPAAPIVASAPATVTVAPPRLVALEQKAEPEFRVQGIIYRSSRSAAFVNGRTVFVGDRVNGATVVNIGPSSVTLMIEGQRKTLELP